MVSFRLVSSISHYLRAKILTKDSTTLCETQTDIPLAMFSIPSLITELHRRGIQAICRLNFGEVPVGLRSAAGKS